VADAQVARRGEAGDLARGPAGLSPLLFPSTVMNGMAAHAAIALGARGPMLTVNEAGAGEFGVNIVPHTLRQTTLGRLKPGDAVNLEVDLLARYLEKLIKK